MQAAPGGVEVLKLAVGEVEEATQGEPGGGASSKGDVECMEVEGGEAASNEEQWRGKQGGEMEVGLAVRLMHGARREVEGGGWSGQ
ncbi:hypothetical protein CLOM_g18657 [Closterium sp. NIES-68]|nr:hypothetical protein CLOM_g18657 [Closterium sp. NIES-68]